MRVTRLTITNLRVMQRAEFLFRPGFNLIVGINGVGKTSVLNALCACLSPIVKQMNKLRMKVDSMKVEDIRHGTEAVTLECDIEISGRKNSYLIHMPRESSVPLGKSIGMPRKQVQDTPGKSGFIGEGPKPVTGKELGGRPLAVLFSTRRAVPTERVPSKGSSAGVILAAFADAFSDRDLRLGEFAAWIRVQKALKAKNPTARRILGAVEEAVTRFLPEYSNLRATNDDPPKLQINRGTTTLEVRQLSDGERGTLALVLDLTRRLAQANPNMSDPAAEAEAVVMIDEIDLHLHPQWQRKIVHNLTAAFPKCQFIATTHSPQVIGEMEHDRIQIIIPGQIYSPPHSFGMDSSRVLEEIMETGPRTEAVQNLLSEISRNVDSKDYARAQELVAKLIEQVGENDPEVTRARTLLEFLGGEE